MIKNYFKIAIRNIWRHKAFSFINIFGLSIGVSCCLLLALTVYHEISFDRFHENSSSIYRIKVNDIDMKTNEVTMEIPITTAAVGPSIKEAYPEVLNYVRFSGHREGYFTYKQNTFREQNITHTDSTLFEVFSFDVVLGDPATMLNRPNSVVLTRSLSNKIFQGENPLGEVLKLDNQQYLTVTGVIEDFPSNSQLGFSALISFNSLEEWGGYYLDWDGGWNYYTYLLLQPNTDKNNLEAKFPDLLEEKINYKYRPSGSLLQMTLTPLLDIHLYTDTSYELPTKGNIENIYIFSGIAIFILLIACMNFINLSTARSATRAKEVGLRKVAGATRKKLIGQFLGESVLLVLIALVISVILIEMILPHYNNLVGINISLYSGNDSFFPLLLIGILLFTGLAAGAYPAFFLTAFNPLNVLKGKGEVKPGSSNFRNSLVILQFALSIGLTGSTFIIYNQLEYVRNKSIGFQKENIIGTVLVSDRFSENWQTLKEEIRRVPGVINVAASSEFPGNGFTSNGYIPEGHETSMMFNALDVDNDYFETMGMDIVLGRNFSKELGTDDDKFIVNQTLVSLLGWEDPLGKNINRNGDHELIGVVGDFHFATMHHKINPLIITRSPWNDRFNVLNIRVRDEDRSDIILSLNEIWKQIDESEPFYYFFIEDTLDSLYSSERIMGKAFMLFALLAIFISGMGLYGLTSFLTRQRTKEIAVRKVHGAASVTIMAMLNIGFIKWILISAVISIPVAWFLMSQWLDKFEYHVEISPWLFLASFLITLFLSVITVSFQTWKASGINSAEALKYE